MSFKQGNRALAARLRNTAYNYDTETRSENLVIISKAFYVRMSLYDFQHFQNIPYEFSKLRLVYKHVFALHLVKNTKMFIFIKLNIECLES
jgi:hypothetical protein